MRIELPSTGEVVGPYRVESAIGEGAAARVYRATHMARGRTVALKVVPRSRQRFFELFALEVEAIQQVRHPNVVRARDSGIDGNFAWMATDLVEGLHLDQWLARQPPEAKLEGAIAACARVADGLAAVHAAGFLHLDLKPANILVSARGLTDLLQIVPSVRLVDFGFARRQDAAPGRPAGTIRYMSPELLTGGDVDLRADLFSLGVVLYELLAGAPPHQGSDNAERIRAQCTRAAPALPSSVPGPVAALVEGLLAKAPSDRPRGAEVVAHHLRRTLGAAPEPGQRPVRVLTSRFIGRRDIVRQLRERVLRGPPGRVILSGPPGSGLSRLLRELSGAALLRGARHILVHGGDPSDPLLRAVDAVASPLVRATIRGRLLGADAPTLLAAFPGLARSTESLMPPGPEPDRATVRGAVARVLVRARANRPLLVAIDDAELVDVDDIMALGGGGLLVLGTHHSELLSISGQPLFLPPLSTAELAEIARSMVDRQGPPIAWENAAAIAGRPGILAAIIDKAVAGAPEEAGGAERSASAPPSAPPVPWSEAITEAEQALHQQGITEAKAWLARPDHPFTAAGPLRYRYEILKARIAHQQGHDDTAMVHAARAGEVAPTARTRARARLEGARGALRKGQYPACVEVARVGKAEAASRADPVQHARWLVLEARAAARMGHLAHAASLLARELHSPDLDPTSQQGLVWTAAAIAVARCDWSTAQAHLATGRQLILSHPNPRVAAGLHHQAGQLHLRRGDLRRATRQLQAAAGLVQPTGDGELEARIFADLARALAAGGELDGAHRAARDAWVRARRTRGRMVTLAALLASTHVASAQQDLVQLRRQRDSLGTLPRAWLEDPKGHLLLASLAGALALMGRPAEASGLLPGPTPLEDPHDALAIEIERRFVSGQLDVREAIALAEEAALRGLSALRQVVLHRATRLGHVLIAPDVAAGPR